MRGQGHGAHLLLSGDGALRKHLHDHRLIRRRAVRLIAVPIDARVSRERASVGAPTLELVIDENVLILQLFQRGVRRLEVAEPFGFQSRRQQRVDRLHRLPPHERGSKRQDAASRTSFMTITTVSNGE